MEYLKKVPRPAGAEKGMDLAGKALTPRSDRPRASYGSLQMSMQTVADRCVSSKCIRKVNHEGACWPASTTAKGW